MSDDTKKRLWALLLIVLTALSGWVVNRLNPTPAPVNVIVEQKPGVFGTAPEVKVRHTQE